MSNNGGNIENDGNTDGVNRRALLKGAVATGAGVAAWSAPNIKTLGFAPAYAQVCSPVSVYDGVKGNIDAGQDRYKDPTPLICGNAFPGGVDMDIAGCNDNFPNPGEPGPTAGLCVSSNSLDGQNCVLMVQIITTQGQPCENPELVPGVTPNNPIYSNSFVMGATTQFVSLPSFDTQGADKYRVFIICTTDPDPNCLPSNPA